MELESDFRQPMLRPTLESLEEHFASEVAQDLAELPNRHRESSVGAELRRLATRAGVLIALVDRDEGLSVLFTRRHHSISYPGHVCFPGGRSDPTDAAAEDTALREAHEEIRLVPEQVRVLGRLGDDYTHSRYRIAPIVGIVTPPLELVPQPGEVEEIIEIPLPYLLRSDSYVLRSHAGAASRAHFSLTHAGASITGPTVCILMGLYAELARTHPPQISLA